MELVEDDVLHEVGLHVEADGCLVARLLVEVVEPAHHLGDGGLAHEAVDEVEFPLVAPPEAARLEVVGLGTLERGVGVAHQIVVFAELGQLLVADPLGAEDGAVADGVVHHLLLPGAVAHEPGGRFGLLLGPLLLPDRLPVGIYGAHLRDVHARRVDDVLQHAGFGDEVAHHDEAATAGVEGAKQCLLDPCGEVCHAGLVAAELVIVEVIDNDVVGPALLVAQSAGALSASTGEEGHLTAGDKLAVGPHADVLLLAVVGNQALVVLQLGLDVAEERAGRVLRFTHHDHHVDEPLRLKDEPQRDEDVEVGRFSMATRPLEDRLEVGRILH